MTARTGSPGESAERREGSSSHSGTARPPRPFGWRLELTLLVSFSAVWLLAVLALFGLLPLAGVFDLGLYRLYSVAAALGWVAGNVYLLRGRGLPAGHAGGRARRRLLLAYLLGPPGVLYLLRSLAPPAVQTAAPLVPLLSFAVYLIFFLVPVTLRPRTPRR